MCNVKAGYGGADIQEKIMVKKLILLLFFVSPVLAQEYNTQEINQFIIFRASITPIIEDNLKIKGLNTLTANCKQGCFKTRYLIDSTSKYALLNITYQGTDESYMNTIKTQGKAIWVRNIKIQKDNKGLKITTKGELPSDYNYTIKITSQ